MATNVTLQDNPTDEDLREIEQEDDGELLNNWSVIVCRNCESSFDMLNTKFDPDGNVICPHCGYSN